MPNPMPRLTHQGVAAPVAALDLVLEFTRGRPPDAAADITPLVEQFVLVGQLGGYPLPTVAADRSGLELLAAPATAGTALSYPLRARNVDPRAFQILRLLVGALPATSWHVGAIQVRGSGPQPRVVLLLPKHETYYDHYPDLSDSVPFTVEWVDRPGKARRYLVILNRPVAPDHLQAVTDLANAWWPLVAGHGFALPTDLPLEELDNSFGGVTQFDEVTIEIGVDLFMAAETAWKVLTNMLDVYTRTVGAIIQVTIE